MKRLLTLVAAILAIIMGAQSAVAYRGTVSQTTDRQAGSTTVAILVIDNFGDMDGNDVPSEGTCVMSAEEQGFAIRGAGFAIRGAGFAIRGAGETPTDEDETLFHGDIVVQEITEALAEFNVDETSTVITIHEVGIDGFEDTELVTAVQDAIDGITADYIVMNMSFAFIPCDLVEGMAAFGDEMMAANEAGNLNNYRGSFQRAVLKYNDEVFPAMSQKFQNATDLHPLQTLIANNPKIIAIASSGNFGLKIPFWPASFGQVVSVSASNGVGFNALESFKKGQETPLLSVAGSGNSQVVISNYGEIMIPGEYEVVPDGFIIGTSFAAPRLSALTAVYLSNVGSSYCKDSNGRFALAYGKFDNKTLSEAVSEYCSNMSSYIPAQ